MKTTLLLALTLFLFAAAPLFASAGGALLNEQCTKNSDCASGFTCQTYYSQRYPNGNGRCAFANAGGTPFNATNATTPISATQNGSTCKNGQNGLCNPLKVSTLQALLIDILNFVIQIGTVIIIFMLVLTGFKFVMARGNPTELGKAKEMLVWTLIGALIILGSKAIAVGIQSTIHSIQATK